MVRLAKFIPAHLSLIEKTALASLFINFAFPKAGIYLGEFPLTLGYVLGGLCTVLNLIKWLSNSNQKTNSKLLYFSLLMLGSTLIFVLLSLFSIEDLNTLLYFVVSYGVVPFVAYNVASTVLKRENVFRELLLPAVLIVSLFGIAQFAAINYFNLNISIPFLTVTGPDINAIFDKNINRGALFKAVSTYNNGNILGVNLLMLLPLSLFFARQWILQIVVRGLILMTLSRTVWLIWLLVEALIVLFSRSIKRLLWMVPVFALGLYVISAFTSQISSVRSGFTLFESSLGGRVDSLDFNASLVASNYTPVTEIVYGAILRSYGGLGLLLFLVVFIYPLLLRSQRKDVLFAKIGMVGYLVAMGLDGAFTLVPTTFVYWALATYVFFHTLHPSANLGQAQGGASSTT